MNHIGENTRDLHNTNTPHPAENGLPDDRTERSLTRWSNRALVAGISIIATTYTLTFVLKLAVAPGQLLDDPIAQHFAVLGLVALINIGGTLISAHIAERIGRQARTLTRRTLAQAERAAGIAAGSQAAIDNLAAILEKVVTELGDNTRAVEAVRRDTSDRLDSVQLALAAVPSLQEAFSDGMVRGARTTLAQLGYNPDSDPPPLPR